MIYARLEKKTRQLTTASVPRQVDAAPLGAYTAKRLGGMEASAKLFLAGKEGTETILTKCPMSTQYFSRRTPQPEVMVD